jgi:hypothetical protein
MFLLYYLETKVVLTQFNNAISATALWLLDISHILSQYACIYIQVWKFRHLFRQILVWVVAFLDELSSWTCKMDMPRILRQVLELQFKGKRWMGWFQMRWFSHVLKDTKKAGKIWHGIEKERLGEYKTELRYFVY